MPIQFYIVNNHKTPGQISLFYRLLLLSCIVFVATVDVSVFTNKQISSKQKFEEKQLNEYINQQNNEITHKTTRNITRRENLERKKSLLLGI